MRNARDREKSGRVGEIKRNDHSARCPTNYYSTVGKLPVLKYSAIGK
jgi:hypothetical protein